MYEVNMDRIKSQSECLLTCLQVIREVENPTKLVEQFAVMRALHIGVECMIDVGNTIIDGFIMRDPGGYLDIVDILEDEHVIPSELANKLKDFVKFREQLVRNYDQIAISSLDDYIQQIEVFRQFKTSVDTFLVNERVQGNISSEIN
jgi:uncharacterized protein YutE (UPF0331/DUF86 family)